MPRPQSDLFGRGERAVGAPAILVENLSKTYFVHQKEPGLLGSIGSLFRRKTTAKRAVEGISFAIQQGEVVGFLSTSIRLYS
mgnify:CR=1 FL=1